MKRIVSLLLALVLSVSLLLTARAESAVFALRADTVICAAGGTEVSVDIVADANPGVAGLNFQIAYDPALTLKSVTRGGALRSMSYTPPGDLAANPVSITMDSTTNDTSIGTLVTLTFEVPAAAKSYPIRLTRTVGNIVDQNRSVVADSLTSGAVVVPGGGFLLYADKVEASVSESGTEIAVPIRLDSNPGIAGLLFRIAYDPALTLKSITRGDALASMTFTPPGDLSANPINITMDSPSDDASTGTVLTLVFEAAAAAHDRYAVNLSYSARNFVNQNYEYVPVTMVGGSVTAHNWNSGTVTVPATCTADGETLCTCTDCGATKTEVLPATGHTLIYAAASGVLTETCAYCDHTATATVSAVRSRYTGEPIAAATVAYADGWLGGETEIVYENNTAVGTATASITAGGATAAAAFKIYTPGDVDGNGTVNMRDVLALRQFMAGGYGVEIATEDGDLDRNGTVNMRDLLTLRQFMAGGYGVTLE